MDSATPGEINQAELLYHQGEIILRKAEGVAPDVRYGFLVEAAECAVRWGDYERAAERLRAATEVPEVKDTSAARRHLEEIGPVAKQWADAVALSNRGKRAEAIAAFQRIAKDYPRAEAPAVARQIRLHIGQQELAQAAVKARDLATRYKGTFQGETALAALAGVYFVQGTPEKALAVHKECLQTYGDAKDRGLVHWGMGRCYEEMRRPHQALAEFKLARKALTFLPPQGRDTLEKRIADAEARVRSGRN